MENKHIAMCIIGMIACLVFGWSVRGMSETDTHPDTYHIERWTLLNADTSFRSMPPEDRVEVIVTYVAEGADPRPAWQTVSVMLTDAFSDIYAEGFVDCQEKCESAIEQVHAVYAMMEGN